VGPFVGVLNTVNFMSTQQSSIKTGLRVSGLARIAQVYSTKVVSDNLQLTRVKLIWNPQYGGPQTIMTEFCNLSKKQIDLVRVGALLHINNEELEFHNWQNADGQWSSYHTVKVWNLNIVIHGKKDSEATEAPVKNPQDYSNNEF
jgi:hypothetical protein